MTSPTVSYPVDVLAAPPAPQSRLAVFFRYFLAIPRMVLLYFLQIATQVITLIAWFAILFTGRYPDGMAKFVVDVLRWTTRANGYLFLLTGAYPPFSLDEERGYPVRLAVTAQIEGRNRLTVFFRPLLAIPHLIVLMFVCIAAAFALLAGWVMALITGSVPAGIHEFIAGFLRWNTRVIAYSSLLTDQYPPFSLR